MTLVFVSNFLNHHQIPLCQAFQKHCDNFYFIATDSMPNIGYQVAQDAHFVVHYYMTEERGYAEKLIIEADVVIFGACSNNLISLRMQYKKLSFLYSERFFKKGSWRRFIPMTRKKLYDRIVKYRNEPIYVLAASSYFPNDLALLGYPKGKCYRWGYFPEVREYDIEKLFAQKEKNEKIKLLWVARMIPLKHPEMVINLAQELREAGYDFCLDMVGDGELTESLRQSIQAKQLTEYVNMCGSCTPDEVRGYMERADIFYFTSDHHEGWGAVLNEAMNSGCVAIASAKCGSTQYLIKHEENGFSFDSEKDLYNLTVPLLNNPELRKTIGSCAYRTMMEYWNPKIAASRFFELVSDIQKNQHSKSYADGPCSSVS